jgi:hypothetical protein
MFDKIRRKVNEGMAKTVRKCKFKKQIRTCLECRDFSLCTMRKYEDGDKIQRAADR